MKTTIEKMARLLADDLHKVDGKSKEKVFLRLGLGEKHVQFLEDGTIKVTLEPITVKFTEIVDNHYDTLVICKNSVTNETES